MIKIQVIGHLGKDCVVKEVGGNTVINFSVCHTESWKDKDGNKRDKSLWVEAAYWTDKTAISQYLVKGKLVYVEGAPEVEGYQTKDGKSAATLRVRVLNIQLLSGSSQANDGSSRPVADSSESAQASSTQQATAPAPTGSGDDLPF